MRPKNRMYCRASNRQKLLFETEKKAENFIRFNKDEILSEGGYRPQRAYFCSFCGGWHVTSIEEEIPKTKREEMLESVLELKKKEKFLKEVNKAKKNEAKQLTRYPQAEIEELQRKLSHELDALDKSEQTSLVNQRIQELKTQIERLAAPDKAVNYDELKKLRTALDVLYVVKKQYNIKETTPAKSTVKTEEWEDWMRKLGYTF